MIQITETADNKIKTFMSKRSNTIGIRIGVKTTGCNGLSYVLEYVDTPNNDDELHQINDIKVYVDPKSTVYLNNITIDYKKEKFQEGFDFINPMESGRCGCGESFHI
jgi:iron-sulfur cluster assembly protein